MTPDPAAVEKLTQTTWEELAPKLLSFYAGVSSKLPADVLLRDRNLYRHFVQYSLAALDKKDQDHEMDRILVKDKDREIERLQEANKSANILIAEGADEAQKIVAEQDSLLRQVVEALTIHVDRCMREMTETGKDITCPQCQVLSLPALQPWLKVEK